MPSASIKKKIPCSKKNLIEMVLDIEKYPEFVPWCLDSEIHERTDNGDTIEIKADLTIGKSFFRDTYKSFVVYNKSKDLIIKTFKILFFNSKSTLNSTSLASPSCLKNH